MQVVCHNCEARYAVDPAAIGPLGRDLQCSRCNHRWFEPAAQPEAPLPEAPQVTVAGGSTFPAWAKALAAVLIVLGGFAYIARDEIGLPGSLHEFLKLEVTPPGTQRPPVREAATTPVAAPTVAPGEPGRVQLEVDLASQRLNHTDGRYVMRGEIVNKGRATASTRLLKLAFKKDADLLSQRFYPLVVGPIAPGARLPFSQILEEFPVGTTEIVPTVE